MNRRLALACAALVAAGCYKLDPFLYDRTRVDHYALSPDGGVPEESVAQSRIEPVTIPVNDSVSLGAVYIKADTLAPEAYVIFFHGQGGNLDSNFGRAKRWANLHFDVLAFDYRGWGASSDVTPTESGIDEDTAAVRKWLVNRVGEGKKIIYYGHSFGTATSTQRAVSDPPSALILESAFASIEDFGRDSTHMDLPGTFLATDQWKTATRIKDVHAPLLMFHGLADDYVRPEFSKEIFANANDPKQLVLVPGADHGSVPIELGVNYGMIVHQFLADHVP